MDQLITAHALLYDSTLPLLFEENVTLEFIYSSIRNFEELLLKITTTIINNSD